MTYKKKIGTAGEELAAELLKSKGYYIINDVIFPVLTERST